MRKYSFLCLALITCVLAAWAVPAAQVTITHQQQDGRLLTLQLTGDEYLHYYINTATGEAMRQGADGDYYVISEADLSAQQTQAATFRAEVNQQRFARLPRMQAAGAPARLAEEEEEGAFIGIKKGLVILVNFQDTKFTIGAVNNGTDDAPDWDYTGTQVAFYNQFNQEGYNLNGHIGSVRDYFLAQSYGKFTVDFDVVGPVTVSRDMAYYGEDGPYLNSDVINNNIHCGEMIVEAVNMADTLYGLDYSQYDWNGDDKVDQVFVIFAGYGQAAGAPENTIWPHEWTLTSANYNGDGPGPIQIDGKTINTYACSSELAGYTETNMDGIGTACHEFSHCLGFKDLYDTDGYQNGLGFGMAYYDLMDAGSYNGPTGHSEVPCGYSAYERSLVGWLTPTELGVDVATITDMVTIDSQTNGGTITSSNSMLADSPSRAYLIVDGGDGSFYFLENRPNTGYFRYFKNEISGSGLFITRIEFDATAWQNNKVNAEGNHQRYIFIPADGEYSIATYATDFYPTSDVTSFQGVYAKHVTNITRTGDLISFDYRGGYSETGELDTITLDAACRDDEDGMVYGTYSNTSSWIVPDDLTVSEIAVVDGELWIADYSAGRVVPANTGVMVSALEGGNYAVKLSNADGLSCYGGYNCLRPTGADGITAEAMAAADADSKFFHLTMHNGTQIGFWWGAADGAAFALDANKAYMAVATNDLGSDGSKANLWYTTTDPGDVTTVENVTVETGIMYNIMGQVITNPVAGQFYIMDGKKYIAK